MSVYHYALAKRVASEPLWYCKVYFYGKIAFRQLETTAVKKRR